MRNCLLIIFGFIATTSMAHNIIEAEYAKAIQNSLLKSLKNYVYNVQEEISATLIKLASADKSVSYQRQLTPEVIEKALYNFKKVLPKDIPMIPFAVAEPTSSEILVYFRILNSYFRNLDQFSCIATATNTAYSSAIGLNIHLNTSSLHGHYELDVSNYEMHLYGDGEYRIVTNGTDADMNTDIEILMDGSFRMTKFLLNISISSAQLNMSNLLGGDPSAHKVTDALSEQMSAEVTTLSKRFQQSMNNSVVDFTNSYLASVLSWGEFVDLVYHLADI